MEVVGEVPVFFCFLTLIVAILYMLFLGCMYACVTFGISLGQRQDTTSIVINLGGYQKFEWMHVIIFLNFISALKTTMGEGLFFLTLFLCKP